jgi:hypothetical protein
MQTLKKKSRTFDAEETADIKKELERMVTSDLYNTESSFTANETQYPDNLIPFLDKHMNYLNAHPSLEVSKYIANLRLMTRIR